MYLVNNVHKLFKESKYVTRHSISLTSNLWDWGCYRK